MLMPSETNAWSVKQEHALAQEAQHTQDLLFCLARLVAILNTYLKHMHGSLAQPVGRGATD